MEPGLSPRSSSFPLIFNLTGPYKGLIVQGLIEYDVHILRILCSFSVVWLPDLDHDQHGANRSDRAEQRVDRHGYLPSLDYIERPIANWVLLYDLLYDWLVLAGPSDVPSSC